MSATIPAKYLGCVFAFAGAVVVGWKTGGSSESSSKEEEAALVTKRADERILRTRTTQLSETAVRMKSIRDAGTAQERLRSTVSLVMSLDPSEFSAWAEGDKFDFRAGPELHVFRFMLFERWLAEDPESLIGWTAKNNHGQAYRGVEQIFKNDPERAIAYFREHPNDNFELSKLESVAEGNPELVLARLVEMSGRGMTADAVRRTQELFGALARKSPESLAAALDSLSPALRDVADVSLTGIRLEKSFSTEIKALWERPDGWKVFSEIISSNEKIGAGLFSQIASMPDAWRNSLADFPYYAVRGNTAKDWIDADLVRAGFTASQATRIKENAIESLANKNPAEALARMDSLNLEAKQKTSLFQNAMHQLVGSPAEAEKLIASLGSEQDRIAAREQLELAKLTSGSEQSRSPSELLGVLSKANTSQANSWYLARATGNWTAEQVADYQKGFGELSAAEKEKVALLFSPRPGDAHGNKEILGDAVRYLLSNPPKATENGYSHENPTFAASQYAVNMASNSLPEASAWIDTLPDGEAKMWARRNLARDLNQYDPAAVRNWMNTLPADAKEDLRTYLDSEK